MVLLAAAGWADNKPKRIPLLKRPNQAVDINGLKVPAPAQKCENFGWAAGLELLLRMQGVALDQKYWITKLEGGELCRELRPLQELAETVNGEHQMNDGHRVQLQLKYTKGAPAVLDDLIVSVREGSPWLLAWKGHPYLVDGLVYDEFLGPNNARIFIMKEIKLLDPLAAPDSDQRQVSFLRERDNLGDVEWTMTVRAQRVE